jgi:23S rRNA (adenine2503-C2)-methyltransferase
MPPPTDQPDILSNAATAREPLFGLTPKQLEQRFLALGWPRFRAKQVMEWVYAKGIVNPSLMTNLSAVDRTALSASFTFDKSIVLKHQQSQDGTQKLLLGWNKDGEPAGNVPETPTDARSVFLTEIMAETVMIPDGDRRTACVSSQVGCPVGCRFCASGIGGVKRNLTAAQIVEQVVTLNKVMASAHPNLLPRDNRVNHIVFMGMGEPLANYANLMQAIRVLHDPGCLNIGARKITVSTVGVPSRMRELAGEDLPINLAISLHAPDEALRRKLIPWAEHFSIDEILDAARFYFDQTGREITLEYILLAGVNDQAEQAHQLARLCKTLRANVNLIRYNQVEGLPFGRPKAQDVMVFQEILRSSGVNAHVRKSRGRDIDAACGQLRRKSGESDLVSVTTSPLETAVTGGVASVPRQVPLQSLRPLPRNQ